MSCITRWAQLAQGRGVGLSSGSTALFALFLSKHFSHFFIIQLSEGLLFIRIVVSMASAVITSTCADELHNLLVMCSVTLLLLILPTREIGWRLLLLYTRYDFSCDDQPLLSYPKVFNCFAVGEDNVSRRALLQLKALFTLTNLFNSPQGFSVRRTALGGWLQDPQWITYLLLAGAGAETGERISKKMAMR